MLRKILASIVIISSLHSILYAENNKQLISVPAMREPVLDGRTEPAEWAGAAELAGFYRLKDGKLITDEEGSSWIGTDGKSLFIAVKTSNKGQEAGTGTLANIKKHDGPVWMDDAVEIIITANNGDNLYQFIVNSAGTVFDAEYANGVINKDWNGKIKTANLDQSGWWVCEAVIPLEQFKIRKGDGLLLNVCRDWYKSGPSAVTGGASYKNTADMLELKQADDMPVVHERQLHGIRNNDLKTSLIINNPAKRKLTMVWSLLADDAVPLPLNWHKNPYYAKCVVKLTDDCASGKHALSLSSPEASRGAGAYCASKIPLESGKIFKAEFTAKGSGELYAQLYLYSVDGKNIAVRWGKPVELDSQWKSYTCELSVPGAKPGAKAPAFARAAFQLKPGGSALIDKLELDSAGKAYNLNGDYEEIAAVSGRSESVYEIDGLQRTLDFAHKLKKNLGYSIKYQLKEKNKVIYRRQINFISGAQDRGLDPRPCTFAADFDDLIMYGRFYPGFGRLALEIDARAREKEKISGMEFILESPSGKNIRRKAVLSSKGRLWRAEFFDIPEETGTWHVNLKYYGPSPEKPVYQKSHAAAFETRKYPWQNKRLGISDVVIPPFTPLQATSDSVACILRKHRLNGFGLWEQVKTLDKDILAGPVTVEAVINGKKKSWKMRPLNFVVKKPHQIITKASAEAGTLKWHNRSTWDYDGFMWSDVDLTLKPGDRLDSLTMVIPMKSEYCTILHAVADTLRTNKAGIIPAGEGEVWNSSTVPKYRLQGKNIIEDSLIPYFWFGDEQRGICWLVDCGRGFNLKSDVPQIRVIRPNKNEVKARIAIINKPLTIQGKRRFSFGLQATPVKPLPKNWRNWNFCVNERIEGMLNIMFCMHGIGLGKTSNCAAEPVNEDYSFIQALGKALKERKPDYTAVDKFRDRIKSPYESWMRKHEAEHHAAYLKYKSGNESYIEQRMRFLDIYLNQNMSFTGIADILVPYTDPRLQINDSEIAKYFVSEWWGPQAISYPGLYRTYPTPSNIDYMLHVYRKHLAAGLGGIYIDDAYIMPNNDPLSNTAVIEDGKLKPVMGLLAMRELIRRTAVLQHQMGINPRLLIVHCSNTFIIPCLAFADVVYDWEMNYGNKDFQDRFPLDLIRTETTGLQAGCIGCVLGGMVNSDNLPANEWDIARKRLTRTALALTLLHEIQINAASYSSDVPAIITVRKLLKKFGIAEKQCVFVPYWSKENQITVPGGNFRCSYYQLPGKILAVVSNMGEKAAAHLELQLAKASLKQDVKFKDFESGKALDNRTIIIPKHDFRLILIEFSTSQKSL